MQWVPKPMAASSQLETILCVYAQMGLHTHVHCIHMCPHIHVPTHTCPHMCSVGICVTDAGVRTAYRAAC